MDVKLTQRADEEEKECRRLMKFEMKFELHKPQFMVKDANVNLCYLRGFPFDTSVGSFQRPDGMKTDSVNFITNIELQVQGKTSFVKSFGTEFDISKIQKYKVGIYAESSKGESNAAVSKEMEDELEIGTVEFTLAELFMSFDRSLKKNISFTNSKFIKSSSKGQLNIIAVTPAPKQHSLPRDVNIEGTHLVLKSDINQFGDSEVQQMSITLKIQVKDLPILDGSKTTNPYFVVFKDGVTFSEKLYQSEVYFNSRYAAFRAFSFGLANQKSIDKPMMIEFWHFSETKKPKFIGIMRTDIYDLRNGTTDFNLVDPDTPYQFRGTVHILKYEERVWISEKVTRKAYSKTTGQTRTVSQIIHRNAFSILNYLGFYEIRFCIAVDFTASNGQFPDRNEKSFHFVGKKGIINPYQKTLHAVSSVLLQFNTQKFIDCFGFGVMNSTGHFKWQQQNKLSLEKPINDPTSLLKAYKRVVKNAEFGLDSNFFKIIQEVRDVAHVTLHYFVLLIILDGDKIDVVKTLTVLKETEKSGLSILFVGIGGEQFKILKMFAREFTNVSFALFDDDMEKNTANLLQALPKHILYHMAIRKNVPELY